MNSKIKAFLILVGLYFTAILVGFHHSPDAGAVTTVFGLLVVLAAPMVIDLLDD